MVRPIPCRLQNCACLPQKQKQWPSIPVVVVRIVDVGDIGRSYWRSGCGTRHTFEPYLREVSGSDSDGAIPHVAILDYFSSNGCAWQVMYLVFTDVLEVEEDEGQAVLYLE